MSAVSDRQRKMEINRSLRNIKNELETLLEKGVITDDAFDSIHNLLPPEGTLGTAAPAALPTPASSVASPLPTNALADLNINNRSASPAAPAPPSYAQSTGNSQPSGPPALPSRSGPPPPAPTKPVLSHARALYRYSASDARDCTFERDDRIAVYEYMNNDWWMGMNLRTGKEGIFPRTYVEPEVSAPSPAPGPNGYYNEKAAPWQPQGPPQPMYAQPQGPPPMQMNQGGGYPAPPPQGVPYNNQAPPAEQEGGGSGGKMGEHGKKFGKKLGNAAIFGAGATIGSNIVNSIF